MNYKKIIYLIEMWEHHKHHKLWFEQKLNAINSILFYSYIKSSESLECNGVNEEFAEVVSACPPTCSRPVGPLCQAVIRKPSCVCRAGTIRDTVSNRCVRREECPKIP